MTDNMMGFNNWILTAYDMYPTHNLMEHQNEPYHTSLHFMRGTAVEVWGRDMHKATKNTATAWEDDDV